MVVAVVTRTTLLVNRSVIITAGSGQEHVSLHAVDLVFFLNFRRPEVFDVKTLRLKQTFH